MARGSNPGASCADGTTRGLSIARALQASVHDAMTVASAHIAGCATPYREDLPDGRVVDGALTIRNPFVRPTARST
jgi:predicted nucleic acid-binding protein